MKAKVVVDNIGTENIQGQWGLCIYIEYNGKKLLLDTGASELFARNAEKMGISIEDIDVAVLSHAHYDHANGMRRFFELNEKADFYLREGCGENCYSKMWIFHPYIGIPKGVISKYSRRIKYAKGNYEICEGISLIPHTTQGLERIGKKVGLYIKRNGKFLPDDFSHEQSLVFDTRQGLVVFNSCSHGGVANIINEVSAAFPDKKVIAVVGGFHIHSYTEAEVRDFANQIKSANIKYVYTGHCTGQRSFEILKQELGDTARQLKVGLEMEF